MVGLRKQKKISYTQYRFSVTEWIRYILTGLSIGAFAAWITYCSLRAAPIAIAIAAAYLLMKKKSLAQGRRQSLRDHFKDFLTFLHSAMRAGYSLENAVASAAEDLEKRYGENDVLVTELKDIVRQIGFRVPVEKLFWDLGRRSAVEDIRNFGSVLMIAKRTGGNMGKILTDTRKTMCDRIDTCQEIDAVIASKKFEQNLMCLMPAGIILYLRFTFNGFVENLYWNQTGIAVMTVCLLLYGTGYLLGRKMTAIEI